MTIIIDNIITPYEIARYNVINKALNGNLEVWFQHKTEVNRNWTYFPKIEFKYRLLNTTLFNLEIVRLLTEYKNKADRIICCGWDTFTYWYALFFCKRNKIRFTLWSGSTEYEINRRRTFLLPLVKYIIKKSDDFIVYGIRAKKYLISLGAEDYKIKIFLNSIDVDFFYKESMKLKKNRENLRGKYGIKGYETVFLYVGQLIERKGLRELVNAFKQISSENKNSTLIIVGDGPLKNEIIAFINSYPEVNIKLTGYLQYNKMPEIYAVSDVLVLPSKQEVWGLVVNEALVSRLPVIVSKFAGCCDDLVNHQNGEIITDITVKKIAEALNRFLSKKNYQISQQLLDKMNNKTYAKLLWK